MLKMCSRATHFVFQTSFVTVTYFCENRFIADFIIFSQKDACSAHVDGVILEGTTPIRIFKKAQKKKEKAFWTLD